MPNQFSRTEFLLGKEVVRSLQHSRVAVFGIGGVGGSAVEALARSGIGALDLVDDDRVCLANLNRQIFAIRSAVGKYKVDAAAARIAEISPDCLITAIKAFYLPSVEGQFDFSKYDYIIDAVDTVASKIELVMQARPPMCLLSAPWLPEAN